MQERTKNAQFIIISLRNNMFELADRLVGIYKTYDVTKSVTINPKRIAATCLTAVASKEQVLPPTAEAGPAKSATATTLPTSSVAGLASSPAVAALGERHSAVNTKRL
ncbi:MAG: hypothetical protein EOO65_03050 [Methanosarcinales archaeon]|nr:MAG: hypothetical protein EOO65_03050 [Methanosarcinales archaeon]